MTNPIQNNLYYTADEIWNLYVNHDKLAFVDIHHAADPKDEKRGCYCLFNDIPKIITYFAQLYCDDLIFIDFYSAECDENGDTSLLFALAGNKIYSDYYSKELLVLGDELVDALKADCSHPPVGAPDFKFLDRDLAGEVAEQYLAACEEQYNTIEDEGR